MKTNRIKIEEKIATVQQSILDTVSSDYINLLSESQMGPVRDLINGLKEAAGQSNGILEQRVETEINHLKAKKKNTAEEEWIADWKALVRSAEFLEDSHLTERYICKQFIQATYTTNSLSFTQNRASN
jgi:hypothetical protein